MQKVMSQVIKTSTFGADVALARAIRGGVASIAGAWRRYRGRRRERLELERLYQDERLLKDIGLTRGDLAGYGPSETEMAGREIMRKLGF